MYFLLFLVSFSFFFLYELLTGMKKTRRTYESVCGNFGEPCFVSFCLVVMSANTTEREAIASGCEVRIAIIYQFKWF